jgi:hypothetical protein
MVPVHSTAFAMDRQCCRRDKDAGVKKDIWSVVEDFAKAPGGKDLSSIIFLGTHTDTIMTDNIGCTVSF